MTDWIARSDVTDAVLSDCVLMFEAATNRRLRVRQMQTTTTLTPSAGSAALPTDYLTFRSVTWTGSPAQQLEYVHPDWMRAAYPTADQNTPTVFTIEGLNITIRPEDTTNLTLYYWQKVPALVTNSTNWLLTAHPDVYLNGSLYEVYRYLRDGEAAQAYYALREGGYDEIERLSEKTKAPMAIKVMGYTP